MNELMSLLTKQVLFFDGGTGSVLQSWGLKPGELPETWNLKNSDKIQKLHYEYYKAGANIVKTNTFGANCLKFTEPELEKIVFAAVENARCARKRIEDEAAFDTRQPRFIALDIGPCGKLIKPLGDISFDAAVEVFKKTIRIGLNAGVDCILIETMNDLYEAKAAVIAAKEVREERASSHVPIFCTVVFDQNALTLTGSSPEIMVTYLSSLGVDALGVNCSLGPSQMAPIVKRILGVSKIPVIVNPNAGLPRVENGKTVFDVSEREFAQIVSGFSRVLLENGTVKGAAILGGCCGTTPEAIRLLAENVRNADKADIDRAEATAADAMPRENSISASEDATPPSFRSSLETSVCSATRLVKIGGLNRPVLIGERINPTGKKQIRQALRENDLEFIISEGVSQEEKGADVLDVNVGLPEMDETKLMCDVIFELQGVTRLPLQIDTSNPLAMEKALRLYNGKPLVNSVNGKQETMNAVFPIVKKYGGTVVALTLDENGIPQDAHDRIEIARRIIKEAEKYGIGLKDLVFDPLAMAISRDDRAGLETLRAVKMLHDELGANTILGVSNVSFGLPCRDTINSAFFTMAMQNGLSCAIMNPGSVEMQKAFHAFCTINGLDSNCSGYIEFAQKIEFDAGSGSSGAGSEKMPPSISGSNGTVSEPSETVTTTPKTNAALTKQETLEYAIIKGLKDKAAGMARQLLESGENSMDVINNRLVPSLDFVGKRFEEKKMFLPQLLMAAESAKACFDVIRERMQSANDDVTRSAGDGGSRNANDDDTCGGNSSGKKIVLATVKGDIHDIGKNIVKVLLENYGFCVIDLGKDVSPDAVLSSVIENDAKVVGLSALMTTTVPSMEETLKLLHEKCPGVKVCVGGAVLTQEYSDMIDADFYSKNAMDTVKYAQRIFGTGKQK